MTLSMIVSLKNKNMLIAQCSPPISLTVTFSSISPTILLTATMLHPAQHFYRFDADLGHLDADIYADLGHSDSIVNEYKADDS